MMKTTIGLFLVIALALISVACGDMTSPTAPSTPTTTGAPATRGPLNREARR